MNRTSLCIHRAANEIGGNCIEIRSASGERLLLDAGRPLDTPEGTPTPVPPSLDTETPVFGILLSHAHTDHCGLLERLPATWPVYCGRATEALLLLSAAVGNKSIHQTCTRWESEVPVVIGPFTVTPYLIDHSAFDAYALHIVVDKKSVFYTGDFRMHGRKGVLVERLMRNPPNPIDVLIMEGTNLPKALAPCKPTPTEESLYDDFVRVFKETTGRVFVSWSAANIDRTVTLYKACKDSGRVLVPDIFTTIMQKRLATFAKIPQPDWKGGHMRTVVTRRMIGLMQRLGEAELVSKLKEQRAAMSARKLTEHPERWVIMVRDSLVADYAAKGVLPTEHDTWVWSQWKGYLEMDSTSKTRNFCDPCRKEYIHTSGHASPDDLRRFAEALRPTVLVPIHGEAWKEQDIYKSTHHVDNGQWLNI